MTTQMVLSAPQAGTDKRHDTVSFELTRGA